MFNANTQSLSSLSRQISSWCVLFLILLISQQTKCFPLMELPLYFNWIKLNVVWFLTKSVSEEEKKENCGWIEGGRWVSKEVDEDEVEEGKERVKMWRRDDEEEEEDEERSQGLWAKPKPPTDALSLSLSHPPPEERECRPVEKGSEGQARSLRQTHTQTFTFSDEGQHHMCTCGLKSLVYVLSCRELSERQRRGLCINSSK